MLRPGLDQGTLSDPCFFPVNSRIKVSFCYAHVHFDCAGSHKTVVPFVGHGIFPKFLARNCYCDLSMRISTTQARAKCAAKLWGAAFFL